MLRRATYRTSSRAVATRSRRYSRDSSGRFSSGGSTAPSTIKAKGPANVARRPRTAKPTSRPPAAARPGSMTSILRGTMQTLAKLDAQRIREIEAITGSKIKPTTQSRAQAKATGASARVRATAKRGNVTNTMRSALRELAQSDARTIREMGNIPKDATPKLPKARRKPRLKGS